MRKMIVVCVGAATDEQIAHASRDVAAGGPVDNVAQESSPVPLMVPLSHKNLEAQQKEGQMCLHKQVGGSSVMTVNMDTHSGWYSVGSWRQLETISRACECMS